MTGDEAEETPPEPLTVQAVFDILGSQRRRSMIRILAEYSTDDSVSVADLAEEVVRRDTSLDQLDDRANKITYVTLYQSYVPELEKHGLVATSGIGTDEFSIMPRDRVQTLVDILTCVENRIDR